MENSSTPKELVNQINQLEQELCNLQSECRPHNIVLKQKGGAIKRICNKCLMDCGYATEVEKKGYLDRS